MSAVEASALLELLDAGGLSLAAAGRALGLTEGGALALLVDTGRVVRRDGPETLALVRGWGRVRVILRSGDCVAEIMTDLGNSRISGRYWNDEDERAHLHLGVSDVQTAFVISKVGHASGRAVRIVAFADAAGEVAFKVMIPKERVDLVPAFNALRGAP